MSSVVAPSRVQSQAGGATSLLSAAVVASALGYFVDLYDLILFTSVRSASLADLGVTGSASVTAGALLLNLQSAGLIVGGFLWGVLADKRGRVRILFASIALYSLANLANAFVTDLATYGALRFVAGVGLAGELGVAITLISEVLPKGKRAHGMVLVTTIGVLGGLTAGLVPRAIGWRAAYIVGGVLGLALLLLRFRLAESGLYSEAERSAAPRGSLRQLLSHRERLGRFTRLVLVAVPNWFAGAVLMTFLPEIAREAGALGTPDIGIAIAIAYVGLGVGALVAGFASERFRTRKWIVFVGISSFSAVMFGFTLASGMPVGFYYALAFLSTLTTGYTSLAVLMTAEHFGTNLRGTATASMPNLVRGSAIPLTLLFVLLGATWEFGLLRAALVLGTVVSLLALWALRGLSETHGRNLDFIET